MILGPLEPYVVYLKLGAIALAAALLVAGGWTLKGWKDSGTIERLEGEVRLLEGQIRVVSDAARACSAGVASGKQLGDQIMGEIRGRLKLFAAQNAGNAATVARLEDLLKQPTPPGAGCDKAWDAIEADRKARVP